MSKKKLLEVIRQEVATAFEKKETRRKVEPYKGQSLIIHDTDFYNDDSWIAFNLERDKFPPQYEDADHRIYDLEEGDFQEWIKKTYDVSDYMVPDEEWEYDPSDERGGTSIRYTYFDYDAWKDNNSPEDYAGDFLKHELTKKGAMPLPEFKK